jgi:hypothetical protein
LDLLIGSLLGDGNLQTFTDGDTWRYRAFHGGAQQDYLLHKFEVLRDFCGSGLFESNYFDFRTDVEYQRDGFNTLTNPVFKVLADAFYNHELAVNGNYSWVKHVPVNIQDFLTPATVAYWYMDDGSLKYKGKSNAMRISCKSFSDDDIKRLQKALLDRHGIITSLTSVTLKSGRKSNLIYIPEGSSGPFRELIRPHLLPFMGYKVSDGNKGTLEGRIN